jgi:hypothetical protein
MYTLPTVQETTEEELLQMLEAPRHALGGEVADTPSAAPSIEVEDAGMYADLPDLHTGEPAPDGIGVHEVRPAGASVLHTATNEIDDLSKVNVFEHMSIKKDLLALRGRLEEIDDGLVTLLREEFDYLQMADLTNPDAIKDAYVKFAERFMSIVGEIGNRGQDLSLRRHAISLCFAINPCIQYKKEGDFCRMDRENECIVWLKRMMFYSALLDGGTVGLDTDTAEKIFDDCINVFDSMLVCCRGTKDCPKGNEWSVMEAQLETLSEAHGLRGKDRTSFWWLYGAINAGWRVAYNYARSGQPFYLCHASLRNLNYMYDNPTEGILSSALVNTFFFKSSSLLSGETQSIQETFGWLCRATQWHSSMWNDDSSSLLRSFAVLPSKGQDRGCYRRGNCRKD